VVALVSGFPLKRRVHEREPDSIAPVFVEVILGIART
jgi:hypothetical protein